MMKYIYAVLYELGSMVKNWGDTEWTIAFVCLIGVGYMFLRGAGAKKSL